MTTHNAGQLNENIEGASRKTIEFSGTVTLSTSGVVRDIKGYKKGFPETVFKTTSASDGSWSLSIPGGSNDEFRIFVVGIAGENSEIYEHLTE